MIDHRSYTHNLSSSFHNLSSCEEVKEVIFVRHLEAAHAIIVQQNLNHLSLAGKTPLSA